MTKIFNRNIQKPIRNKLRKNLTAPEVILWSKIKNKQVNGYKFRRQHGIGRYIADFYCPELMLVIEVDGANHFFDEKSLKYDVERQKFLESQGIKVLRISNTDIKENLNEVMNCIYNECKGKASANLP